MSWSTISLAEITAKFTPAENAMLNAVAGNVNLVLTGSAYGSGGTFSLAGLTLGHSYKVAFGANEISLVNGNQTLNASGAFVAQGASVTLNGNASTAVTATLVALMGGLQAALNGAVNEFIGAMSAAGYRVLSTGAVPDQLRRHIKASAVWHWLRDFPRLTAFKTDERKLANADAERIYEKIVNKTYGALEDPLGTDQTTGNWNSNPKVIMRMVPTPPPSLQMQMAPTPLYANPNAPLDDPVASNSPGIPQIPTGFQIQAGNGQILLYWDPVPGATGYTLFWGTSTSNISTAIAVATTNYLHTGLTNGTSYIYQVAALNGSIQSDRTAPLYSIPAVNQP